MKLRTPSWMSFYRIHGHNGNQGSERYPHVHVNVGGYEASVNLDTCDYQSGRENIPRNRQRDVLDWVRENQTDLLREWDAKSNPQGY